VIFVDSNIPMYLVGADHPNRDRAKFIVERAIIDNQSLVTSAEVLQEILHRYVAIARRDAIEPALDAILGLVDVVFSFDAADVGRARRLLTSPQLQARDAIHVAVMQRHDIGRILSFDAAFDKVPGIQRIA
jgi:predicted nucleic acid-binding protein